MEVFLHSQDQGPSHVGEQPELTGSLGLLAVWVLVFWLLAMAVFTANVESSAVKRVLVEMGRMFNKC